MPETKYKLITFRAEKPHLDKIDRLAKKLKLTRSQAIRLSLDEAVEKHLEPGYRGEIITVDKKALDKILVALHGRIMELDPRYKSQREGKEAEELYQKVEKLRAEGKKLEVTRLINESYKKGKAAVHCTWPDSKGELSSRERKKMLKERYGKDFKEKKS